MTTAAVWTFLVAHKLAVALVAFWLASIFVGALPSPSNNSSAFYKWFFAITQTIIGSLPRLFPALRIFNDPTKGSQTYFSKPADSEAPKP